LRVADTFDRDARRACEPFGDADASPVVAQLERLEAILLRGSITQSEFDEQKRRLLG